MDMQYVLDPYACATYILSYITKGQRDMSRLLEEATEEVRQQRYHSKSEAHWKQISECCRNKYSRGGILGITNANEKIYT